MAASTPDFKGIPSELRDKIFVAYFKITDNTRYPPRSTANLFLAFPDFHANIRAAISIAKPFWSNTTVTDLRFHRIINCFLSGHRTIKLSHFQESPQGLQRYLIIDLVFTDNSDFDVKDLLDGLQFFSDHNIIALFNIYPPSAVKASAHDKFREQFNTKGMYAGRTFRLGRVLSEILGRVRSGHPAANSDNKVKDHPAC